MPDLFIESESGSEGSDNDEILVTDGGTRDNTENADHEEVLLNAAPNSVQNPTPTPEQTPPGTKRTRTDKPRKNVKKQRANAALWNVNVKKTALNQGKEHVNTVGKLKPAREVKPGCTDKCNRCSRRLTDEEKQAIHAKFWGLGKHDRQLDYVLKCIKCSTPQKKMAAPGNTSRASIRTYTFTVEKSIVRVCKKTFLETLNICDSWVKTALNNSRGEEGFAPKDRRGTHDHRANKASIATRTSVLTHIDLVPKVESHYTRSRSRREYVESGLSVERLHVLYLAWAQEEGVEKPASISLYRKIFNEERNIGIFKPKKDQCGQCAKWKNATTPEKAKMAASLERHQTNRRVSRELKDRDRTEAIASNGTICTACYDLQKVLPVPKSEVGTFFYLNKLSAYNFTVFETVPSIGTCYLWTEVQAKRGSNEIASNVFNFMKKKSREGVKEFRFYSDSTTSQNKNRVVFAMYLLASRQLKVNVIHRFLEPGHTQMEVDSIHARIELESKGKDIFDINGWYEIILNAKKNGYKYNLEKVHETVDVLNFKPLVEMLNWDLGPRRTVSWMKVRQVSVNTEEPNVLSVKYDYLQDDLKVSVVGKKKGRPIRWETFAPPKAYTALLPLPAKKAKDLRQLMRTAAIPRPFHSFFEDILKIGTSDSPSTEDECPEDCPHCESAEQDVNDEDNPEEFPPEQVTPGVSDD